MIKLKSIILENDTRINTFKRELMDFIKKYRASNDEGEKNHLMTMIKIAREEIEKEKKKPKEQREYEFNRTNFLKNQYTGYIGMNAYEQYKTEKGLEWLGNKTKYPILLEKKKHGDFEVEYRQKDDPDDQLVVAFIDNKPIGWASNEFGSVGVWVIEKYQKLGIGTELTHKHIEQRPDIKSGKNKLGQMTTAGQNLTMKYYDKYGKDWFDKQNLKESFELPPDINSQSEILAKFIASLFLRYFETRVNNAKTKPDFLIIKYNEYYRLAKQYRKEGKLLFGIMKDEEDTMWGKSSLRIYPKSGKDGKFIMPDVILKITNGYNFSTDGYVNDTKQPQEISILVNTYDFITSFKKSTKSLIEIVKHEIRHYHQITHNVGLPKLKVLKKSRADIHGFRDNKGYAARERHHMRDIEFKTNLHSYKSYIENFLNRNFPKNKWKEKFNDMVTGKTIHTNNELLDDTLNNLDHMKKKDFRRWKLFIKELYKLIFPND